MWAAVKGSRSTNAYSCYIANVSLVQPERKWICGWMVPVLLRPGKHIFFPLFVLLLLFARSTVLTL